MREATRFGPYWLDARLAVGGTAEVYLARPVDAREAPARLIVKRLLPHIMSDPEGRTMFEREARLHAAVRHDNVVRLHDWGVTAGGEPYLALEFVDGVDCFRLLRRLGQDGRNLGIPTATRVAIHVLDALSSVHAATDENGKALGIIHRDVTPSNVFLSKRGDVKLGDFGIARAATARATIRNGDGPVIKGKYAYLAPEQVGGDAFDHRADVFALACVLVEMILGRPLFSGSGQLAVLLAIRDCRLDPLIEAKASLPAGMFEVLERGLAREPAGRFESAAAFAAALEPFADTKEAARSSLAEEVFLIQTNPSASSMAAVRESMRALRTASGQRPAVVEERVLEPVAATPA
ncbi:MAG: serine/threonine-protein kinase [Polyangiaceae bacterium]